MKVKKKKKVKKVVTDVETKFVIELDEKEMKLLNELTLLNVTPPDCSNLYWIAVMADNQEALSVLDKLIKKVEKESEFLRYE